MMMTIKMVEGKTSSTTKVVNKCAFAFQLKDTFDKKCKNVVRSEGSLAVLRRDTWTIFIHGLFSSCAPFSRSVFSRQEN